MKKIVFVLPSLNKGGAEKVMLNLFQNIRNYDKKIIIFDEQDNYFEGLINFNNIRLRKNMIKLIRTLHKEKPDIIMASHFHINIFLILLKKLNIIKSKVVVRQSFTLSSKNINKNRVIRLSKLYRYADLIIFQTQNMKNEFETLLNITFHNSKVIYNSVDVNEVKSKSDHMEKFYLAVGRLSKVKNFSYLIESYNKQNSKELYPLYIVGKGPEEKQLQALINKYQLQEKIILIGEVENLGNYYKKTYGLLISSLNEGLPNVLLEALSYKCNVIVRKHPGGTEEVLSRIGLLRNFVEDIDFNFSNIIETQEIHLKNLEENFGSEVIIGQYQRSFKNLLRDE
ncbi:glycosyltransferase [Salinicoccus roseus]|uniref:glycosyltransferase n=1 Tax=Salinicoccus roseus TaxID=45670 RepID=UPI0035695909